MLDTHQQAKSASPRRGWILYDGQCGFCFRWVHLWQGVVERRGFGVKDLQSASADASLQVPQESLLDDIRVLTSDGKSVSGADAYLFVARQIWWAWPFYAIFTLPGFNWLLWQAYRWVNRNRYRLSGTCVLPQSVEIYSPERKAAFLLSTAITPSDYRRARKDVQKLGVDPDAIPHRRPT